MQGFTLNKFLKTQKRITPHITQTPFIHSSYLSEKFGSPQYLKLDNFQKTGSFKFRGACNAVLTTPKEDQQKGFVGFSTGNFGKALAYSASLVSTKAYVCVSKLVPQNKIDGLKMAGAHVVIDGNTQDEAEKNVQKIIQEKGCSFVDPFDDANIITGQGSIGLEVLSELSDVDTFLLPVSGGGLAAGIAAVAKQINPNIRTIGISMENGAAMAESLKAKKPVLVQEYPSLADSLGGGIGLNNRYTFKLLQDYLDDMRLVSEDDIYDALQELYFNEAIVCEGASAVGLAAMNRYGLKTGKTVHIISGRNIDMGLHKKIIQGMTVQLGDITITGNKK